MADFAIAKKRTYAVYIRSRVDGRDVLLREAYNVVEYDPSDPNRKTYIEGLPMPGLRLAEGGSTKDIRTAVEVVDDIRVYDAPPFNTRLGSRQ